MNKEVQVCGAKLPSTPRIVKDRKAQTRLLNDGRRVRSIRAVHAGLARSLVFLVVLALVGTALLVLPRLNVPQIDAATPLSMPPDGKIDPRFNFASAWETAQTPTAARFDPPLGTEHGGLVYNAQRFWEMNEKRGGHHTGDDLNGIGGMNTDLGDPVYSTADGLVLYVGEPSPGWGKTVVIGHRTLDGTVLHSMAAHLHRIDVKVGDLVARGEKIGAVGTADGQYPAHLHFEIRASDQVDIGAGYAGSPLGRLDPATTVSALRNAPDDDLSPSPLNKP
jgi:murein DD-endopeptidase MepM/ murein hydrolase activator NlpD